jgi:hypothetical protein
MQSSISKQIQDLVMIDGLIKGQFKPFIRGAYILLAVLLALGFYTNLPPYFMVAAFIGIALYSAHRSSPHLKNAARALTEGQKKTELVRLEAIYDSEAFTATLVNAPDQWQFTFIPLNWKPSEGEFPATIYHLSDVVWPVLVEIEQGIMVPREIPKRSTLSNRD